MYLLANHLAQLVDILEQHVVVRHGHPGKRGCSPQDIPPTPRLPKGSMTTYFLVEWGLLCVPVSSKKPTQCDKWENQRPVVSPT